jgi:ABC-type multidrug transport system ATPase subunit
MKITLTQAGKRFHREWIFRQLDYEFLPGQKYAVTGPNGSGKSTLLQALSGALTLNEGHCDWQENEIKVPPEKMHQYVSIAAPYLELIEEMTATEFLHFHSHFKPFLQSFPVDFILHESGLHQAAGKQIRFYSSGMKQRLKLAQAIFSDVPVVLLDEPCTNLDINGFELYYRLIDSYCNNRTVIVCSNDVNEYKFIGATLDIMDYKVKAARTVGS